jgi:NADPH:quinone reductase-like Zn-dependent oxidoreductase
MKQWVTNQDGLENIKLVEASMPDHVGLQTGEVLVKVNRVSLNYRDTEGEYQIWRGHAGSPQKLPLWEADLGHV